MRDKERQGNRHNDRELGAGHIALIVAITTSLVVAITAAVIGFAMFA
ncbi:hypothetical protein [Pseudomonas sp. Marseille-Q7302]